jgi:hypothetical protein
VIGLDVRANLVDRSAGFRELRFAAHENHGRRSAPRQATRFLRVIWIYRWPVLLHSPVPHPFRVFLRKGWETTNQFFANLPRGAP